MRKLKIRKVMGFVPCHRARQWGSRGGNANLLIPEPDPGAKVLNPGVSQWCYSWKYPWGWPSADYSQGPAWDKVIESRGREENQRFFFFFFKSFIYSFIHSTKIYFIEVLLCARQSSRC